VDGGARVFWLLIALLFGTSLYFGLGVSARRGVSRVHMAETPSEESGH